MNEKVTILFDFLNVKIEELVIALYNMSNLGY
jgi:hypothetical protein